MTAIRHGLCERRAMPDHDHNTLIWLDKLYGTDHDAGRRNGETAPRRQILPGRLRPVNH
jgi:hypothetical protein